MWWHQNSPGYPLLSCADPAVVDARYQRRGHPGVWYGSSKERSAWAELFRHTSSPELSPFHIRRRVGRVRVTRLRVLDLTNSDTCAQLGVHEGDLTGDDYTRPQVLAALAYDAGLDGLLAPSAALAGHLTLALFAHVLADASKIVAEHSRVQAPPVSLLDRLSQIRPIGPDAAAIRAMFARLISLGKDAIRRLRG